MTVGKAIVAQPPATPVTAPASPHVPSQLEQDHVKQALEASQTAMEAIGTIVTVSTWALGIITVALALIAVWGYAAIKRAATEEAKQIANKGWADYIQTDAFKEMVKAAIAQCVQDHWENTVASRIEEEQRGEDDPPAFPPGDPAGDAA